MKTILIVLLLFIKSGFSQEELSNKTNDELNQALIGIQGQDSEQIKESLTYILRHQPQIPSSHLFFASAQAYALEKLEVAGYLYFAGQLRAKFDLKRFPPVQKGGDSPAITLINAMRQVGLLVTPDVYRKPEVYARIVQNLTKFSLVTPQSYDPGWEYQYQLPIDQQRVILLDLANNDLKQLADFSLLLNNEEYFKAFKIVQDINSLEKQGKLLQTYQVDKQNAEAKMLEIETSMNIVGLFYKGKE